MALEKQLEELAAFRGRAVQSLEPLCYAPFAQLHFTPDGNISTCSKSVARTVGHVTRDRILDVWRGPAMAALRASLGAGRFATGCHWCEDNLRQRNVRNNPLLDFDKVAVPADPDYPARLEFAFSDLCNLACVHCSPSLSSVLRTRAGLPRRPRVYDDAFFAQLEELVPHLHSVSLLGGEPFLQEEVHRLLDLLERQNPRVQVHVTTNGTVWNERVERWLGSLHLTVSVSIDGATRSTFERMRVGARFERVLANTEQFQRRLGMTGRLRVNFCLMRGNWHEFAGFLRLADRLGAEPWVTTVTQPPARSLFSLGRTSLLRLVAHLEQEDVTDLATNSRMKWSEMLGMLRTAATATDGHLQVRMQRVVQAGRATLAARSVLRRREPAANPDSRPTGALDTHEAMVARAVAHLPDLPSLMLANLLRAQKLPAAALAACQRVAASSPDRALALVQIAEHHLERGEHDLAEPLLAAAAASTTQPPPDLHLRTAWLHFHRGRIEASLTSTQALGEQLARMPSPPPHLQLGLLALQANLHRCRGHFAEALAAIEELVRREPDNPGHALFLAIVREELPAET